MSPPSLDQSRRRREPPALSAAAGRGARRLAVGIVLVCGLLGATYSLVTPPWEAPDEVGHFAYLAHLVTHRRLPEQRPGELGEAHQPPLYYLLAALAVLPADLRDPSGAFRPNPHFIWAGQGGTEITAARHTTAETFPFQGQALALHLARGVSVLLGMATVALTIALGRTLFPEKPAVGLLAGALVTGTPQFLFISGAVNNDTLLTTLATAAWWQLCQRLRQPEPGWRWLGPGLWAGLAVLTKLSGVVVALVFALLLGSLAWQRRSPGLLLRGGLALGLPLILLPAPWFLHNQALYGDPLGWGMYQRVFAVNLRTTPLQWSDLSDFVLTQVRSFWGVFGWMTVPAPWWLALGGLVVSLGGLLGLARFVGSGGWRALHPWPRTGLLWLAITVLVQEAFLVGVITRCNASCYQGRYLFPVIAPLAVLVSVGLLTLGSSRPGRLALVGLVGLLWTLAAITPFAVIAPAYPRVPLSKLSLWELPALTPPPTFGQMIVLRGYRLTQTADGSRIQVLLYWQALRPPDFDYSVFVHLIDAAGTLVAQKDHAPGAEAGYPPTAWAPGDIVADEHVISVPPTVPAGTYRLRVGVYNWATGRQLPVEVDGRPAGTFVLLDQTVTIPRPGAGPE